MEKLIKKFKSICQQQLELKPSETVIVASSGGADSTALLHLLDRLPQKLQLVAVYIDHNLRPSEVTAEKEFMKEISQKLGAHLHICSVDVNAEKKAKQTSTEEAARNLRYQALRKIKKQYSARYIAVGHNADDQMEEFFIRLLRGSGSKGLGCMPYRNDDIIRPLLDWSKGELLTFLQSLGTEHCEDSSNHSDLYLRNRIRHHLVPQLLQYNPNLRDNLAQTSEILRVEDDYLEDASSVLYHKLVYENEQGLSLEAASMNQSHLALQRRLLEKCCWKLNCRPTYTTIQALIKLSQGENGRGIHLAGGLRVKREANRLQFRRGDGVNQKRGNKPKPQLKEAIISEGKYIFTEIKQELYIGRSSCPQESRLLLAQAKITFPLHLRYHQEGERFRGKGAAGSKKISKILIDKKIHGEAKLQHPLLCNQNDEVIAILGLQTAEQYAAQGPEQALELNWRKVTMPGDEESFGHQPA